MLRWLYIQLIWLHPTRFRWRFGDDMLDDFDRAPNRLKPRYLADAVASLARQWLLRPEFRHAETSPTNAKALVEPVAAPLFQIIEDYNPHPAALLHGGFLAILSILTSVLLIGSGGGPVRPFPAGIDFSRPSLLPIARNSIAATGLNVRIKLSDPSAAWLKLARHYFISMPVLRALDANRDFSLSSGEIDNAAAALRQLDTNHDGKLTTGECGLHIDLSSVPAATAAKLRGGFMSDHPVLAALDADHDGEISAWEIDRAAAALKKLDRNHDAYLTPDEFVPLEMAIRAGLR